MEQLNKEIDVNDLWQMAPPVTKKYTTFKKDTWTLGKLGCCMALHSAIFMFDVHLTSFNHVPWLMFNATRWRVQNRPHQADGCKRLNVSRTRRISNSSHGCHRCHEPGILGM